MGLLAYALTTVSRQKTFQGITGASYDTVLERLINSATDYIEKYCGGRRFKKTAYTNEEYDGAGTRKLVLRNWPVDKTATTTLQYRETYLNENEWGTENSEYFKVDYDNGLLIYATGEFEAVPLHYRVSYTAGYNYDNVTTFLSDVGMADLEYACWILVKNYFEKKQKSGDILSESIGNYSISFSSDVYKRDSEVREILDKYCRPMAF